MIDLGVIVKDKVSGLKGYAVARIEYLNGCKRIAIQPQLVKDGKPAEMMVIQ